MTVPPLFDHLDTEDEDQLRRDMSAPLDAGFEADTEHRATRAHPGGVRERAQAWLHVEPFYWTMRVVYVCLAAGAVFAVYINGVAEGWWHAWGEKPSVAATAPATQPTPTASPTSSSEPAMSGGYQIGPDGVLVRPAGHQATHTPGTTEHPPTQRGRARKLVRGPRTLNRGRIPGLVRPTPGGGPRRRTRSACRQSSAPRSPSPRRRTGSTRSRRPSPSRCSSRRRG